jgi:hypothetical protein
MQTTFQNFPKWLNLLAVKIQQSLPGEKGNEFAKSLQEAVARVGDVKKLDQARNKTAMARGMVLLQIPALQGEEDHLKMARTAIHCVNIYLDNCISHRDINKTELLRKKARTLAITAEVKCRVSNNPERDLIADAVSSACYHVTETDARTYACHAAYATYGIAGTVTSWEWEAETLLASIRDL